MRRRLAKTQVNVIFSFSRLDHTHIHECCTPNSPTRIDLAPWFSSYCIMYLTRKSRLMLFNNLHLKLNKFSFMALIVLLF